MLPGELRIAKKERICFAMPYFIFSAAIYIPKIVLNLT